MIFVRWNSSKNWHIFAESTTLCGRAIPPRARPETSTEHPFHLCRKCNTAITGRRKEGSHQSHLEAQVAEDLRNTMLDQGCVPQHPITPKRKWALDFAWPKYRIALEVNGGTYNRGRHSRGTGQRNDYEKWSEASILGWLLILVDSKDVKKKVHIERIQRAMEARQHLNHGDDR